MNTIFFKIIKLGKQGIKDATVLHSGTYIGGEEDRARLARGFKETYGSDVVIYSKASR